MAQPKNTNRIEKLNSLIQRLVGTSLPEFLDGQNGLVTVSRVETSGDSRWAKVWVSIVGGDDDKILATIQKNIYDIQGELNRQMGMKMTPRLQFFLDTSPRYVQHIDELIKQIHEDEDSAEEDGGAIGESEKGEV
ncbi:MAG TPA: 30S ribosome-binding factor RbfA [Patescibacteria group bacterium]|jgi:ribosome-binding factor A|nr:30S ribosome-binding factor RbfA [Patescibacteria group bacterium]